MRRIPSHNFFARLHQRLAETGSFERADMVRVRIARTPAVEQNVLQHVERESKNEYTKCSKLSRGFPLQRLEDSPRTRHASVSRAACPDTATGRLCTSCCFRTAVVPENVLRIPFFLMKCCFPMRHPSQGKEFSTRITTIFGRWRIRMQYDVV
ncbi:DUF4817 domain-containing protein [Trichonephila clavipes]|nr:DUF4817 domain-containing protein [Trichonephila clavipes]